MNLTQCDDKTIKLLNYYSIGGTVIDSADTNYKDYSLRFRALYDQAQKGIATTVKKIRRIERISQNPIPSQINNGASAFDVVQHLADDIIYSAIGSKAYTFKVDNIATIYIEEETSDGMWSLLQQINHTTPVNKFTEYKGLITSSDSTHSVRVRFGGLYPYNLRDVGLFAYTFVSANAIPQYQRYNLYTMPTYFYKLDRLTLKGSASDGRAYNPAQSYYWEAKNVLAVDYYCSGEFAIEYFAYPLTIDNSTLTTYEFEIDEEAAQAIPLYTASMLAMHENPALANKLFAMYQGALGNLDDTVTNGATSIANKLYGTPTNRLNNFNKL